MSRSFIIPCGSDLVEYVAGLVEAAGTSPESTLVVFPNRRPCAVLAHRLAKGQGGSMMAPHLLSIDDFIERQAISLGLVGRKLGAADGAALIYRIHSDCILPGGENALPMEDFLAWGFALFSDFEELKIEGINPDGLEAVRQLAGETLPSGFARQLKGLGQWYAEFFGHLERRGFYTRALAYSRLARGAGRMDLARYSKIILAGFFALSRAEREIITALLERDNVDLVLRDGPGIERTVSYLGITPERIGQVPEEPEIKYLLAGDSHGMVMTLGEEIKPGEGLSRTALTLCREDTVYPVLHHLLPHLGDAWNISMGYPLARTPLYSLLEAIAQAQEGREGQNYFLPYYLRLLLHPYVKNLSLGGAGYPTRMLLHGLEEELSSGARRLVSPRNLEADEKLWKSLGRRLSRLSSENIGLEKMRTHLAWIHGLVLYPFEQPGTVADFSEKLLAVLAAASGRSRAGLHSYAGEFFQQAAVALAELGHSLLADESFKQNRTYFSLLRHFTSQVRVPFPGSPLRGLQVLGFLETRGLSFEKVVLLDVNEGVLPSASRVDTLLPQALRMQLGLSTAVSQEAIDRYHFENLIRGAKEVVLGYTQGDGALPSRFIEELTWRRELRSREGERHVQEQQPRSRLIHFDAKFSQAMPTAVGKTSQIMEAISRLRFSASMLDGYLHCGLRFFYRYLAGIREKDEVSLDIEKSEVGTLVHRALEIFFKDKENIPYVHDQARYREMERAVEQAFAERYGSDQDGNVYLIKSQVMARMKRLVSHYRNFSGSFQVLRCEHDHSGNINLKGMGLVPIYGRIDRIDQRGNETVIVDYKTGSGKFPAYDKFVANGRSGWPRWLRSVQLPLYILLFLSEHQEMDLSQVNSELLLLGDNFESKQLFKQGEDREAMFSAYCEAIATLVGEIRDPHLAFGGTEDPLNECQGCPYRTICGRQWVRDDNW